MPLSAEIAKHLPYRGAVCGANRGPYKKGGRFMPTVLRISAQAKVDAATYQDPVSHSELLDLDTMIALIQALNSLGL